MPRVPIPAGRRVIPVIPLTFGGFTEESRFLSHGKPKKEGRVRNLGTSSYICRAEESEVSQRKKICLRLVVLSHVTKIKSARY